PLVHVRHSRVAGDRLPRFLGRRLQSHPARPDELSVDHPGFISQARGHGLLGPDLNRSISGIAALHVAPGTLAFDDVTISVNYCHFAPPFRRTVGWLCQPTMNQELMSQVWMFQAGDS